MAKRDRDDALMGLVEEEEETKQKNLRVDPSDNNNEDEDLDDDDDDDFEEEEEEVNTDDYVEIKIRLMNDEEIEEYMKQVSESDGFDVQCFGGVMGGCIVPLDIDGPRETIMTKLSREALKGYNQTNNTTFEFDRLLKATHQCVQGTMFYITFAALSGSGTSQTFRVKVWHKLYDQGWEVKFSEMI